MLCSISVQKIFLVAFLFTLLGYIPYSQANLMGMKGLEMSLSSFANHTDANQVRTYTYPLYPPVDSSSRYSFMINSISANPGRLNFKLELSPIVDLTISMTLTVGIGSVINHIGVAYFETQFGKRLLMSF